MNYGCESSADGCRAAAAGMWLRDTATKPCGKTALGCPSPTPRMESDGSAEARFKLWSSWGAPVGTTHSLPLSHRRLCSSALHILSSSGLRLPGPVFPCQW